MAKQPAAKPVAPAKRTAAKVVIQKPVTDPKVRKETLQKALAQDIETR